MQARPIFLKIRSNTPKPHRSHDRTATDPHGFLLRLPSFRLDLIESIEARARTEDC